MLLHYNIKNIFKKQIITSLLHFGTEKELEQGTATDDIAAGDPPSDLASSVPALILHTPDGSDPPSDLASSVPALILHTPDGSDPPSDLASSVPALILHTPDGLDPPSDLASSVPALSLHTPDGPDPPSDLASSVPALSLPTPDGSPPSPDDHFLPPPGWLESPGPSLQIVAASASPISVLAASESSSDVVVPATLQSPPDPVFSAPLSSLLSFTVTYILFQLWYISAQHYLLSLLFPFLLLQL